jgi:hypothetical protein
MRFFSLAGVLQRARRAVSRPSSVSADDVQDPVKLAEILRQLSLRVQELESKLPPEGVEFEKDITGTTGAGVNYSFVHNFGVPIRWYVVHWSGSATVSPALVYQSSSTANVLTLKSHSVGRVVLRIEPSQHGLT